MRYAFARLPSLLFAATAISVAGLAGCTADPGDDLGSDLAENREKWDMNRPAQYTYTFRRSCFCPDAYMGPFLVAASADSVLSARRVEIHPETGLPPDTLIVDQGLQELSVARAFDGVEALLQEDNERESVTFDPKFGFPASVSADNPRLQDAYWGISISDFRPLDEE